MRTWSTLGGFKTRQMLGVATEPTCCGATCICRRQTMPHANLSPVSDWPRMKKSLRMERRVHATPRPGPCSKLKHLCRRRSICTSICRAIHGEIAPKADLKRA